jgi:8-oxo-dGTP pyrophosphatase MutT (NUDIX family)
MRALGWNWVRQTVGEVENNRRRLSAAEVIGLAVALEVTIPQLMAPSDPDGAVEFPNGLAIGAVSVERLAGRGRNDHSVRWNGNELALVAQLRYPPGVDAFDKSFLETPLFVDGPEPHFTRPPIVAAVVTSELGVLVGKRNDGKPPWTFPAGEQDAVQDENPADTAVRETKEETGLRIQAGDVIGERDHPKTGRHMIYIAAKPTRGTEVFVGDEEELAEVKWASLAEADELLPGMFGPVREHLEREIGGAR